MEGEKRKPEASGGDTAEATRKKARDDGECEGGGDRTGATEEEVEEFYAILRRMRAAVQYLERGKRDDACKSTDGASGSTERIRLECRPEVDGVVGNVGEKRPEDAEKNAGFDLNADPDPE